MQHCSPEQLALAALREELPAEDAAHLAGCGACQAEVASLQRGVDALAVPAFSATGPEVAPPPRVWDAIAAATGATSRPRPATTPVAEASGGSPSAEPPRAAPAGAAPVGAALVGEQPAADVVPLRPRSAGWSRNRWLTAAAAVLVGAVAGGTVVALTSEDGSGSVVAQAALDPLDEQTASGRAEVRESDGLRSLQIDLDAPPLDDGYYEVWLLEPDAVRMVPLGAVRAGDTVLQLPEGLDLVAYPVVDVSIEPLDGDPTHSGVSVVRGQLSR